MVDLSPATYARTERMGKIEFGNDFYGVLSYVVLTAFKNKNGEPIAFFPFPKQFSIDKKLDWWNLLRRYVSDGKKIKFCCGKLAEELGICWYGGWAHDEEKREKLKRDWGI
ncbi:hypothetical protein PM082_022387 [Marasmius tenuissimus]|nr:hypothetical protein PM082_022387 [Marasmius tenuissimus]